MSTNLHIEFTIHGGSHHAIVTAARQEIRRYVAGHVSDEDIDSLWIDYDVEATVMQGDTPILWKARCSADIKATP